MARVIITLQIMPESPDVNLEEIKIGAKKCIAKFGADIGKEEIVPVAFGLQAVKLMIISDEAKGGTDNLEEEIRQVPGVQSVEVTDVRRAIG